MADVVPFMCWRPKQELALDIAAAPYDTFSRVEARAEIKAHPLSFLRIDKPVALFDKEIGEYDARVYQRARKELHSWYEQGIMVPDNAFLEPAYFVYRLTQGKHTQTGIIACASVADYCSGTIKRHEKTRPQKEEDRVKHIRALEAHTGPVLLTYPSESKLDTLLKKCAAAAEPLYNFVAADGVRHEFWRVEDQSNTEYIREAFAAIPLLYIADGHHRAAAAARVAQHYEGSGNTEAGYFLAALFGSEELQVLDYNRVIEDKAGLSTEEILAAVLESMAIKKKGSKPYKPAQRGEFGMYVDHNWYKLTLRKEQRPEDLVDRLDVSVLHNTLLEPLFQITDPRSNPRISYVGGARGLAELAERADKTDGVAFALYPCSLAELFTVAQADRLMPPKSTWFEPKPRSGLAIHRIQSPLTPS